YIERSTPQKHRAAEIRRPLASRHLVISTFQSTGTGAVRKPLTFLRIATGATYSPTGIMAVISMLRFCTASAISFCFARSDVRAKSSRSFSIAVSQGHPNEAFSHPEFTYAAETGFITSAVTQAVRKAFQPPASGGSFLERRATRVCQSIDCISTLKPAFSIGDFATGARLVRAFRSVECISSTGVPS